MDNPRRYQIFLSSTYEDLKEHRKVLIQQILKLGHIPAGMELFSAGNEDEFKVIKKAIDQSDLYVVLIGANYGSVKANTDPPKSYTQLEFEYARDEAKKPCMVFLLNETEFHEIRQDIQKSKKKDHQYADQIRAFRSNASKGRIIEHFSMKEPFELVANFQTALLNLLSTLPLPIMGYVRAREVIDIEKQVTLLGAVGKTDIMRDIVVQLNKYDKLAKRMNEQQALKRSLASYFWQRNAAQILRSGYRTLLFESGSTLAYLSSELSSFLDRNPMLVATDQEERRVRVKTNNILTYLSYVLLSGVKTSLVPYGPPDTKYGATYGDIALHFSDDVAPSPRLFRRIDLPDEEREVIHKIKTEALIGGTAGERKHLFLAAASGLELVNKDPLCQGPHVGTYRNMLLKRAIYETDSPVILFLDETKIDRNFNPDRCYSVMTKGKPWEKICAEYPIAICYAAASKESFTAIAAKLHDIGFYTSDNDPIVSLSAEAGIAYCGLFGNAVFYDRFDELAPAKSFATDYQ